jgi:hypothetical protein
MHDDKIQQTDEPVWANAMKHEFAFRPTWLCYTDAHWAVGNSRPYAIMAAGANDDEVNIQCGGCMVFLSDNGQWLAGRILVLRVTDGGNRCYCCRWQPSATARSRLNF